MNSERSHASVRESLQDRLDAVTARTRELVQPERLLPNDHAVAELLASGAEDRMLAVGARTPEWTLADSTGKRVRSADLLALGPLVITFFRGRWCPYCVGELLAWQELYPELRALGALLVAISPQTVRHNSFAADQHGLSYPVLSDPGLQVAQQFGLAYQVPAAFQRHLRSILVNLPHNNGEASWRLPLPATYVLAPNGTVVWAQGFADWRVRPEPAEAFSALQPLF